MTHSQRRLPAHFAGLQLSNTYAQLPDYFFSWVDPTPAPKPALIAINYELARELNVDGEALASPDGLALLAGNALPGGLRPIAQVYAGHQFGYFNPQLGDGRAMLLGEQVDRYGQRRDLQLKGAGPTPYSRNGDGRAALGPVVREYLVSEAMHRLGIKTTRALAAVATGATVYRQTALPGAVLTRVAASHVRIGTFEFFARRGDTTAVRQLADFVINRHYAPPQADAVPMANPYLALLKAVIAAQAQLVAQWLQVGFIHGVMNTDNMSISGETIDYGPCAFMEAYDPASVYSSIDQQGRYAYGNQGSVALWNLTRFAECLLPLLAAEQGHAVDLANDALSEFGQVFNREWQYGMGRKLGLTGTDAGDQTLIMDFLTLLQNGKVDYTLGFRLLASDLAKASNSQPTHASWLALFAQPQPAQAWLTRWHQRLQQENASPATVANQMAAVNPLYIPRNTLVETAIAAAYDQDFSVMEELMTVLSNPYTQQPGMEKYAASTPSAAAYRTFCGT